MPKAVNPSNAAEYWEFMLLYVDDLLCISCNPFDVINKEIGKYWTLKESSIGPPKIYLGNRLSKVKLENVVEAWSLSASQYVKESVKNVEDYLKKKGRKLLNSANAPFTFKYLPELDTTDEVDPTDAA